MATSKSTYVMLTLIVCTESVLTHEDLHHTVFEVTAFNVRERLFLYDFSVTEDQCVFVNSVTNEAALPIQVAIADGVADKFEDILQKYDFQFDRLPIRLRRLQNSFLNISTIDQFLKWDDMLLWIDHNMSMYPNLEKRVIWKTFEDREIFSLKISKRPSEPGKKPAVFIIGGEQGRDWISSAVILNFISKLLPQNSLSELSDLYDFYFIPVANPDGYQYSINKDRFWAKNRRRFYGDHEKKECLAGQAYGVNTDRNWYWARSPLVNNEGSDCNSVYLGPKIFSERESEAVFNTVNNLAINLMAFIDVRGFDRVITVPYAHTREPNVNFDLLMEILSVVQNKLKKEYNASYYYGTTSSIFYNFTGNAADCIKEKLNIPIVMSIYLKYGDDFLPSSSHIEPLTKQLITILEETLLLAYDIYSPLFNSGWKCHSLSLTTLILVLMPSIMK